MSDDARTSKDRSPNFPYIPLAAAIDRAVQFYAVEKRNAAPFPVAVKAWNMSPSSSGALQTVAALKSYGLMSDDGSGSARKVRLTELALRITLDSRPGSTEKLEYMRQAARMPQVAATVYNAWPDGLPSEANLYHYLVLEMRFNATTAHKVVSILQKNQELVGLGESSQINDISSIDRDTQMSDRIALMSTATASTEQPYISRFMPAIPAPASQHGEEIANIRVSRNCTIRLIATGPYSRQSIESLVKQLQLGLDLGNFDESVSDAGSELT